MTALEEQNVFDVVEKHWPMSVGDGKATRPIADLYPYFDNCRVIHVEPYHSYDEILAPSTPVRQAIP